MNVHDLHDTSALDPVIDWRRHRLIADGFEPSLAFELARDFRCDVHALLDLHRRGCPPELAARILAPID
jgi:hypothetical protein